jgi:hypothetical protein
MSTLLQILTHAGTTCLAIGLLASCSSASEPVIATSFDDLAPTPIATATGSSVKLNVAVYTTPSQPPPAGDDGVELIVTDATTGDPVEGLTLAVTPWMPAMGHGTCCIPTFTNKGKGHYVSTDVSLFMPGEWQLRTQFSGKVSDFVTPTFDVP